MSSNGDTTAWKELHEYLRPGEVVEGIVFGEWADGGSHDELYVPLDKRGVVLSLAEAEPFMQGWQFSGRFGGAECHPVHIWTTQRVLWVHEYDGSTRLASAPRHPRKAWPQFDGGDGGEDDDGQQAGLPVAQAAPR